MNWHTIMRALILSLAGSFFAYGLWSDSNFRVRCETHLDLAASASSIAIAQEELAQVTNGCKQYHDDATKSFWKTNFEQQATNLRMRQNANSWAQDLALEQFRESMKRAKESIRDHRVL